jgi:hypothetical protein
MEVLDHYIHPTTLDLLGMIDVASLTIRAFSAQADSVALTPGSKSVEKIGLLPVPIPGRDSLELSDWKFDTRISQSSSHRYLLMQVSRWSLARKTAVIDMDDDENLNWPSLIRWRSRTLQLSFVRRQKNVENITELAMLRLETSTEGRSCGSSRSWY